MRQVVLNFHGIGKAKRPMEPGEGQYWVSKDFFEQTMILAGRHKDRVRVDITFDDGNLSDLEIALPILTRHARRATFFVLADRIGSPGSLGADDMREIVRAGHQIGSHGAAHINWRTASPAVLEHELGKNTRDAIEKAGGQHVTAAAIPFGSYNATVLKALSRHGYRHVYSSDGGPWLQRQWPIPRTSPKSEMTTGDIEDIMLGREPTAVRLRRMLSMRLKRLV